MESFDEDKKVFTNIDNYADVHIQRRKLPNGYGDHLWVHVDMLADGITGIFKIQVSENKHVLERQNFHVSLKKTTDQDAHKGCYYKFLFPYEGDYQVDFQLTLHAKEKDKRKRLDRFKDSCNFKIFELSCEPGVVRDPHALTHKFSGGDVVEAGKGENVIDGFILKPASQEFEYDF